MDRQISETKYRFSSPDPLYSTFYNKKWTWDRNYSLNWNFAKAIKFNFNAIATSVIDERPIDVPWEGFDPVYNGRIDTDIERDLVLNNIRNLGRDKRYSHNFSLNYTVPLKQIPFLDWMNVKASYQVRIIGMQHLLMQLLWVMLLPILKIDRLMETWTLRNYIKNPSS